MVVLREKATYRMRFSRSQSPARNALPTRSAVILSAACRLPPLPEIGPLRFPLGTRSRRIPPGFFAINKVAAPQLCSLSLGFLKYALTQTAKLTPLEYALMGNTQGEASSDRQDLWQQHHLGTQQLPFHYTGPWQRPLPLHFTVASLLTRPTALDFLSTLNSRLAAGRKSRRMRTYTKRPRGATAANVMDIRSFAAKRCRGVGPHKLVGIK